MQVIEASAKDMTQLMMFYQEMCEVLGEKDFLPNGDQGGFPSADMVAAAIESHEQFIGIEDEKIVAAYILSHDCDTSYRTVQWNVDASIDQVLILHALRVLPEYGGQGYSKQLIKHAIQTARGRNQKAIRLDVLEGNEIPEKVYRSFGFRYIDTVEIFYEDIGIPMKFRLLELAL